MSSVKKDRDNYIKQNHSLSLEKQDINMRSLAKIECSNILINTKDQEISSILGEIVSLKGKISLSDETLREKDKETAETLGHLMNNLRSTNSQLDIIQDEKKAIITKLETSQLNLNSMGCKCQSKEDDLKDQLCLYHLKEESCTTEKIDVKKNNNISLVEVNFQNKIICLTKDLNKLKNTQDDIYHFINDFTSKNKISFSDNIDIVTAVKGIMYA